MTCIAYRFRRSVERAKSPFLPERHPWATYSPLYGLEDRLLGSRVGFGPVLGQGYPIGKKFPYGGIGEE